MLYRLLIVVCFLPGYLFAQDWQCLYPDFETTFVDTAQLTDSYPYHTMWVVNIDSTSEDNGWTYYYNFTTPRLISIGELYYPGFQDYCFNPKGASRIGTGMSARDGENFFFNSEGYGIRFSTLRNLNAPWICCRINDTTHLYAVISGLSFEPVLGVEDSVKYVSFQAKHYLTGDSVEHPMNHQVFALSKHFGMLTLYDFYDFPNYQPVASKSPVHILAGIKDQQGNKGEHNLTSGDIYSFSPGDMFHIDYAEEANGSTCHGTQTKTIWKVLEKSYNNSQDSVVYKMEYYQDDWLGYSDQPHVYSSGVTFITYRLNTRIDKFPEASGSKYKIGIIEYIDRNAQRKNSIYNSRWIKSTASLSYYLSCADTLAGGQGESNDWSLINFLYPGNNDIYYYIEGCGGPYYHYSFGDPFYHKWCERWNKLVYYKKGAEEWGTPFDTATWSTPDTFEVDSSDNKLQIFPNPARDVVTVIATGHNSAELSLAVFSVAGLKAGEYSLKPGEQSLSLANYRAGMYFAKLYQNGKMVGYQKIVKF